MNISINQTLWFLRINNANLIPTYKHKSFWIMILLIKIFFYEYFICFFFHVNLMVSNPQPCKITLNYGDFFLICPINLPYI